MGDWKKTILLLKMKRLKINNFYSTAPHSWGFLLLGWWVDLDMVRYSYVTSIQADADDDWEKDGAVEITPTQRI